MSPLLDRDGDGHRQDVRLSPHHLRTFAPLRFSKVHHVVPSVAIREGVLKNIEVTGEHFRALYNNLPFEHFVYDAKSGEDITRGVLTQIIVEEEGKGRALLPTTFLRQLIGFYGDQMQSLVPRFLEQAMSALAQQQEQMRSAMQKTMGNLFPFGNMEEVSRQNMAMMERAFSLFTTPFYRGTQSDEVTPGNDPGQTQEIAQLRAELETLRRQLEAAKVQPAAAKPTKT